MGSYLYASIERSGTGNWWPVVRQTTELAKGIVVEAFGNFDREICSDRVVAVRQIGSSRYLTRAEWMKMQEHEECPWRLDEPYWVRLITGEEFVAIVREKRWQKLQDGDFREVECSPELRAVAALVESLLGEKVPVRVYCWHSQ